MANEVRLIDANALIATIEKIAREDKNQFFHLDEITQEIFDAPTIDPESPRPKGRWVDQKWNDMWQSMTATCSHCLKRGEVRVKTNEYGMRVIDSAFCPNCGADMRGEEDGTS